MEIIADIYIDDEFYITDKVHLLTDEHNIVTGIVLCNFGDTTDGMHIRAIDSNGVVVLDGECFVAVQWSYIARVYLKSHFENSYKGVF